MNSHPPAQRVFGIVPAAGRSRRMGSAKQLLEFHGRPMLMGIAATLSESAVTVTAVVTHPAIHKQLHLERLHGVFVALNDEEESEMIDSIRIGLNALAEREGFGPEDGVLICPGDKPGITVDDVDACVKAFCAQPERIVVASYQGRRGHPMIFPAALAHEVHSEACNEGLMNLMRTHEDLIWEVPRKRAVLEDVDTPLDYQRVSRR